MTTPKEPDWVTLVNEWMREEPTGGVYSCNGEVSIARHAYAQGQREMRERAAKECEKEYAGVPGYLVIARGCAKAIRALPVAGEEIQKGLTP